MYLNETGELKKLGFKLVMVSSLGENANLITNHLVDAFAATQYEFINYRDEMQHVVPLFSVDRSYGADKIHSNVDIERLKKAERPIDVYLELGSVNDDLFKAFVLKYRLQSKKFIYHHDPQTVIQTLQNHPDKLIVVVSYEPYSSTLRRHGIKEVASSRNLDILILDLTYANLDLPKNRPERYRALKAAFWRAKAELDRHPRAFYNRIRKYLEGQSYDAFLKSLSGIQWLIELDESMKKRLNKQGIDTSHLL
ncbi:hypothetical protein [Hydrogenimonas sp. SS33]|uniref:hypothetical protein n=1 Tax=Hydrogenimonas leucolamina TaxID=2954236 RepID=UPI00336C08C1